ncbi:MAG: ABC transporter permease [Bacteroidia bacterium]|nr:ABC transporter permease [Bacteroidia bacterium]
MNILRRILFPFSSGDKALEKIQEKTDQSFWGNVKKQYRRNRLAMFAFYFIVFLASIALLADFIANEKPLACSYKGNTYFPVFRSYAVDLGISNWPADLQNATWKELEYDWVVFPPVPYLPKNTDVANSQFKSPFDEQEVKSWRWKHHLGTDDIGHDVLSSMIHGTRTAMLVGLISMFIASMIGIILGSLAGYFGDQRLKASRASILFIILFLLFGLFYAFSSRSYILSESFSQGLSVFFVQLLLSLVILAAFLGMGYLVAKPFKKIPFLGVKVNIPVDIMISRLFEVMYSIPTLFLIISISAIIEKPSIYVVMVIIGFTSWPGIARFIRAELLRVRSLEYIEAAQAMGFSEFRIIFKHAIPNALSSVFIALAFGIASAILTEAFLSFLGVGVPPEQLTWGTLLAMARTTPTAWWLAIFPGFAIFITVTIFNLAGDGLTEALDPRLRK